MRKAGSLLIAACALPGLCSVRAHAENPPEQTTVGFKLLSYQDWQDPTSTDPLGDRIKVGAPTIYVVSPVSDDLAVEAAAVVDSVSGASPYYHSTLSGASGKGIHEQRTAGDIKVIRYLSRSAFGLGVTYSTEHDYVSTAMSADARFSSSDNNRTYAIGISHSSDEINAVAADVLGKTKDTNEAMIGVTQVLTPADLLQINLTYSMGKGYFTDPYKAYWGIDRRPDSRNQTALLTRYNHYFDQWNFIGRFHYRYYQDTFGVKSDTFVLECAKEVPGKWVVTPSLRYYTQGRADFYYSAALDYNNKEPYYSADQRLSAFAALTTGVKVEKEFAKGWSADIKVEYYQQRSGWRVGGGSDGLAPFYALFYQIGIAKKI